MSFWTTHIEHRVESKRPAIRPGVWWRSRLPAVDDMDTYRVGITINRRRGLGFLDGFFAGFFAGFFVVAGFFLGGIVV